MKRKDGLRKIFDSLSMPVLLIDRNYVVVEANRAALSHVREPGAEIIGRPCFNMTHGSDVPCWHSAEIVCPVRDAFETRKRVRAIHKHQIGDRLVIEEIMATPLEGETGEVDYVIEEFRDVTELLDLREGMLPICASCKKIRDEKGSWLRIEAYFHDHTGADFSHSLCPDCLGQQIAK
jgi:PAS domain-containing protein